eukprot:scaffold67493_cov21-Phaeocystis_antarctica.AAC.1
MPKSGSGGPLWCRLQRRRPHHLWPPRLPRRARLWRLLPPVGVRAPPRVVLCGRRVRGCAARREDAQASGLLVADWLSRTPGAPKMAGR